MQESTKPHEILKLEEIYNITLREATKKEFWKNNNTYALDNKKNIIALNLNKNQISEIKNLDALTALETLDLSNNQISEIKNLDALTALETLVLSNNQISEIKNLDALTALETLDLWSNQISEIKNLDALTALETLDLSSNKISEIKNLDALTALEMLDLSNNQISEIKNLDALTALKMLVLSNNQISEIKNLDALTALKMLFLSNNQISEIKNLDSLAALKSIDLGDNQISEVQLVEKLLKTSNNLEHLKLYNNPFLETIGLKLESNYDSNNLDDLKNYFKDIAQVTKTVKSIKKIMLIGNHDSGKSTFLKHFINNSTDKTESTHILNIMHYPQNIKDSLPEAIIYDFGGQDYYHGLYKAFMTNHATNLIFWQKKTDNNNLSPDKSGRTDNTQNFSKGYWIRQLHYFDESYNKRVPKNQQELSSNKYWLIQTHTDQSNIEFLNDPKLSPDIYREFHINSKDAQDIDLESLKKYLLKNIELRSDMQKSERYIDVVEYVLKQKKSNSTLISTIIKKFSESEERIKYILSQLTRQGLILYYPHIDAISNRAWLNPTKTVQKIHDDIFNAQSISKYKGKVPKNEFEHLCEKSLRLMLLENKVIFLDDTAREQHYIIPSYLPRITEDSEEYLYFFDMKIPCITFKFEYFIPFGFMNRLISIYGKTPDVKKYWRDMLLFTLEQHIKIFIKLDFEALMIKLYVVGNEKSTKKEIEDVQRNIFEDILAFYQDSNRDKSNLYKVKHGMEERLSKEIQQVERIIPDDLHISLNGKHFVHYDTLEDSKKTKESILAYQISDNKIDKEKATSLSTRAFKNFSTNMEISKMKKIFVSYSRKDIAYRDELRKHLNMLKIFDIADNWACEDMQVGKWHDQIQKELEESDLIIYMLSANFFSSSYILEQEVVKGMEQIAKNPNKKILPIIVSAFAGLDKLKKAIDNPTDAQQKILGLGDFQYLAYGKNVNSITGNSEEKIMSLKEFSNNNQLEEALSQIVEKIIEIL